MPLAIKMLMVIMFFCYDDDDDDGDGGGYVTSLCFLLKVDRWGCPSGAPPSGVL